MLDEKDRRVIPWGVGLGLWGAISGVALFLTWDSFWRHHPGVVGWELMLAVVAAYVGESARERVEGHEHRKTSIFTVILILVTLEFFVLGWHGVAEIGNGRLRDVSRRILGETSTTRGAKLYAFEIISSELVRLEFQEANSVLTNPDPQAAQELRVRWVKATVHPSVKGLPTLRRETPAPLSPEEQVKALSEEEERERVMYRILQLQTPMEQRAMLDRQTVGPDLDRLLEKTLNTAIGSVDFYKFMAAENEAQKNEEAEIPPVAEMERLNRKAIDRLFPETITPLPEPSHREWIDLALAIIPLLIVGLYLGAATTQLTMELANDQANAGMRAATFKGLRFGALAGAVGAFVGFFLYLFLLRLGYFLISNHSQEATGLFGRVFAAFNYVLREVNNCVQPAIEASLMFALPGGVLGAIVPWLRPPSRSPRFWSGIALIAAILAVSVSLLSHNSCWWIVIGSLASLVIVWGIRLGKSIEWYWTTAGFVVALFVCAVTVTAQATLGSVLTDLHLFIQKPADPYVEWNRQKINMLAAEKPLTFDILPDLARAQRKNEYLESTDFKSKYSLDLQAEQQEAITVGRSLEVCIMGGLGFWVTIAALVAWKIKEEGEHA